MHPERPRGDVSLASSILEVYEEWIAKRRAQLFEEVVTVSVYQQSGIAFAIRDWDESSAVPEVFLVEVDHGRAIMGGDIVIAEDVSDLALSVEELRRSHIPPDARGFRALPKEQRLDLVRSVSKGFILTHGNSDPRGRWSCRIVPYEFDGGVADDIRDVVNRAMGEWGRHVTFVERTTERDYLRIVQGDRYAAGLGRQRGGGAHDLTMKTAHYRSALHELGHVLGLAHEHSRRDRDQFIEIKWENVLEGTPSVAFDEPASYLKHTGPYDFNSIMHYRNNEFTGNGRPTIVAKVSAGAAGTSGDPDRMGRHEELSEGDRACADAVYTEVFERCLGDSRAHLAYFQGDFTQYEAKQLFKPHGMSMAPVEWFREGSHWTFAITHLNLPLPLFYWCGENRQARIGPHGYVTDVRNAGTTKAKAIGYRPI